MRSSSRSTRRDRSPAAIAAAVSPIASSGRRPRRTSQSPSTPIATRTSAVTISSIRRRRSSVESTSSSDVATTSMALAPRLERGADAVALPVRRRRDGEVADTIAGRRTRSAAGSSPADEASARSARRAGGGRQRREDGVARRGPHLDDDARAGRAPARLGLARSRGPSRARVRRVGERVGRRGRRGTSGAPSRSTTSATTSPTAASAITAEHAAAPAATGSRARLLRLPACSRPGGPS